MTSDQRVAVACYWSPHLVLVLLEGTRVLDVRLPHGRSKQNQRARFQHLIEKFITRHWPELLVLEARTADCLGFTPQGGQLRVISAGEAKEVLLPGHKRPTHHDLYEHLLAEHPHLRGLVHIASDTGVTKYRRWQTAKLLAVALGLAASLREDRR